MGTDATAERVAGVVDELRRLRGRGPLVGFGANAHAPWSGLVEETPCLWVTWLAQLARLAGVPVTRLRVSWGDIPIPIECVALTYGARAYLRCPCCGRRCETIYRVAVRPACRRCQRLGYRPLAHRPGSWWATLERLCDRDLPIPRHYQPNTSDLAALLADLLWRKAEARIAQTIDRLTPWADAAARGLTAA